MSAVFPVVAGVLAGAFAPELASDLVFNGTDMVEEGVDLLGTEAVKYPTPMITTATTPIMIPIFHAFDIYNFESKAKMANFNVCHCEDPPWAETKQSIFSKIAAPLI